VEIREWKQIVCRIRKYWEGARGGEREKTKGKRGERAREKSEYRRK